MSFHIPKIDVFGYVKNHLELNLPDVRSAVAQALITELRAMPTATLYGEARAFGLSAVDSALNTVAAQYPVAKVLIPFLKPLLENAVVQTVSTEHMDRITDALTVKLIAIVAPPDAKSLIAARAASQALTVIHPDDVKGVSPFV